MRIFLLACILLIPGCAAPPDVTVPGADGQARVLIRCRDTQNCLVRAARYCPTGYVDSNEGRTPHELLIRCREAEQ